MSTLRVNTVQNAAGTGTPSAGQLGQGQTWQDLTASRAFSTNYTNSTGRTIYVQIAALGTGGTGGGFTVLIDGVEAAYSNQAYTNNARVVAGIAVPPGAVYRANPTAAALLKWMELRT